MSQRRTPIALLAAAGIAIAFTVSGCFLIPPTATPTPTQHETDGPAPSATPGDSSIPTPTTTPPDTTTTPPPSASGCAPTTAKTPAGAVTHSTIDVDGDGHPDTEWLSGSPSLAFGVTTASGATFSYPLASASPSAREGFIARLNDHRIVSIVDDNRAAYVHFFVNCAWVTTKRSNGTQYPLDFNNLNGTGTGVGCSFGYVESYEAKNTATGYTVTETPINLNGTGSIGTPGAPKVLVTNASVNDPRVKVAQEISCVSVTVSQGGVVLPG